MKLSTSIGEIVIKNDWQLVHKDTKIPAVIGEKVESHRGWVGFICGGTPPKGKTDKGFVATCREPNGIESDYFPKVYGLMWVKVN